MRILNWNIRHGGGSRRNRILGRLAAYHADVVVLTEYRAAPDFLDDLRALGYQWIAEPLIPARANGVLVGSRHQMLRLPVAASMPTTPPGRWLEVTFPDFGFRVAPPTFRERRAPMARAASNSTGRRSVSGLRPRDQIEPCS
jgi:exonuclease III